MAIAKEMICEKRISSRSTGKALAMVVVTFWWLRNDSPRFPWTTLLSQVQYCCEKRLVEAELLEQRGAVLRGLVRPEDRVDRIARQKVHEQEGQDRDHEHDHDQLAESGQQIASQVRPWRRCLTELNSALSLLHGHPPGFSCQSSA